MYPDSPYGPVPPQPQQPGYPTYPQQQQQQPHTEQYYPYASNQQPVAYDQFGNPLFAHPQEHHAPEYHTFEHYPPEHAPHEHQQFNHHTAQQPAQDSEEAQALAEVIKQRYQESVRKYPHLNLSEGEYVISSFEHHPIGIVRIWGAAIGLILVFVALLAGVFINNSSSNLASDTSSAVAVGTVIIIILSIIIVTGALGATYVFNSNRFYLTNESVIQIIQSSIFAKREQTISLVNIEDASYKQTNFLQAMLDYGSIRLSTQGDETTYRYRIVKNPKRQVAILNNAVEAFKNGRVVDPNIILNVPH